MSDILIPIITCAYKHLIVQFPFSNSLVKLGKYFGKSCPT